LTVGSSTIGVVRLVTVAGIVTLEAKNKAEELISTLFDLKNTLASLNYYAVLSQRLSLKP
jgi:hypothetical protein